MLSKTNCVIEIDANEVKYLVERRASSYNGKCETLEEALELLKHKYKVKTVDVILSHKTKMCIAVKVSQNHPKKSELRYSIEEEVQKYLRDDEDIFDYAISSCYKKENPKHHLVAVCEDAIVNDLYNSCLSKKIKLGRVSVPEDSMFKFLESTRGIKALVLIKSKIIRILVSSEGAPVYTKSLPKSLNNDIENVLSDTKMYIASKYGDIDGCWVDDKQNLNTLGELATQELAQEDNNEFFFCYYNK